MKKYTFYRRKYNSSSCDKNFNTLIPNNGRFKTSNNATGTSNNKYSKEDPFEVIEISSKSSDDQSSIKSCHQTYDKEATRKNRKISPVTSSYISDNIPLIDLVTSDSEIEQMETTDDKLKAKRCQQSALIKTKKNRKKSSNKEETTKNLTTSKYFTTSEGKPYKSSYILNLNCGDSNIPKIFSSEPGNSQVSKYFPSCTSVDFSSSQIQTNTDIKPRRTRLAKKKDQAFISNTKKYITPFTRNQERNSLNKTDPMSSLKISEGSKSSKYFTSSQKNSTCDNFPTTKTTDNSHSQNTTPTFDENESLLDIESSFLLNLNSEDSNLSTIFSEDIGNSQVSKYLRTSNDFPSSKTRIKVLEDKKIPRFENISSSTEEIYNLNPLEPQDNQTNIKLRTRSAKKKDKAFICNSKKFLKLSKHFPRNQEFNSLNKNDPMSSLNTPEESKTSKYFTSSQRNCTRDNFLVSKTANNAPSQNTTPIFDENKKQTSSNLLDNVIKRSKRSIDKITTRSSKKHEDKLSPSSENSPATSGSKICKKIKTKSKKTPKESKRLLVEKMDESNIKDLIKQLTPNIVNQVSNFTSSLHKNNLRSTSWIPPTSPHNLIEEYFYRDPWSLLIVTIFLNRTNCNVAWPYIKNFLETYKKPEDVLKTEIEDLTHYFRKLGLARTRAKQIWKMSHDFLYKDWKKPSELYGIGKYGEDAYRIFYLGDLDCTPSDRYLKIYKAWYKKMKSCLDRGVEMERNSQISVEDFYVETGGSGGDQ